MKKFVGALAMLTLVGLAAPAEARMRAGMLNCTVAPSVGYIVGSQKAVTCRFNPVSGRPEKYNGRITKIGLDVGFTNGGQITWAVYTAAPAGRGALAGSYGGASAEATVAGGVGANVLVGGFGRSITLQPVSVGSQTGLNVAVAVSGLDLAAAR
jgi:hypothetical protein